ncbi:TlyA family RNA methyltransferase [Dehalobacter sp. DCM]|uniref:TlyA family RNA methyltransferase n=1 Tax=Dehalobacter sp. DCM TaxID=2907827 RepID=UPI0030817906|nr:TlyA family RNA methyltransferase [Dehalobacter sp. DCM]
MAKNKIRLDLLLVEKGLVESREKAKSLIMAGKVYKENICLDKPGTMVQSDTDLILKGEVHPFVSRGGLKLAKAITVFDLDLKDKVIADIGASTGGFTDCALQNGAAKVYAIDVGYGQLAWKLRQDNRVVCLERTNARYLSENTLGEKVDWVVCDVSFISLTKIFAAMTVILKEHGQALVLIKPQFEAGPENVGKNGVVRDPKIHRDVLEKVLSEAEHQGFQVIGLDFSPIRGPEGNIEFLAWLRKNSDGNSTQGREDQNTGLDDMSEKNERDWPSQLSELVERAQMRTE